MKIWISAPFDDRGVREIDTIDEPSDERITCSNGYGLTHFLHGWYKDGISWHRTKYAAHAAAEKFRKKRITDAKAEAKRIASLPAIQIYRHD